MGPGNEARSVVMQVKAIVNSVANVTNRDNTDCPADFEPPLPNLQMSRATLRLEGAKFLLKILNQDSLLPSVKYAILCGWLGLAGPSGR